MSAVPIVINGVFMPRHKGPGDRAVPAIFIGYATIAGLEVSGGLVIPDTPPDPPTSSYATIAGLEVGGGPVIPDTPPDPPTNVPPDQPPPSLAVVIKPAPVTGGWGLASQGDQLQWLYTPGQ